MGDGDPLTNIRPEPFELEWRGSWSPRDPVQAARLARLPVLQRLLMTMDGTVTTALETLVGERICVRTLDQREAMLAFDDDELELRAGESVIERRVVLHGAQSGTALLYGASRIVARRLSHAAGAALTDGDVAIGIILQSNRLETLRTPLRIGLGPATDDAVPHLGSGFMCRRRYAIHSGGQVLMVIDEQFPAAKLEMSANHAG